jgi:hypothetical protein
MRALFAELFHGVVGLLREPVGQGVGPSLDAPLLARWANRHAAHLIEGEA